MGVVKGSADAATQEASASGEAEKSAPSSTDVVGASPSAAATAAGEAGGSGSTGTRIIPFQSLPPSVQEELGKDLFDDPLLTPENMRKLQDCMEWSFKFTHVSLVFPKCFLMSSSFSNLSIIFSCRMFPIGHFWSQVLCTRLRITKSFLMRWMLWLLSDWMSISICEISFMRPTESILEKLIS